MKTYILTLPERLVRSVLGLSAGLVREVGEAALPDGARQTQLYQNLVDATLRLLIEQVGGAEGVYSAQTSLPDNFLARRTAGNAVEALGIVAFRASPVWVLAALADVCGAGRQLIPEIAAALKQEGLLDATTEFTTVDQLLDGMERTSSRLASTVNTPPLDVGSLRKEWEALREDARRLPAASLPSWDSIGQVWTQLKDESAKQERSVFDTSSAMAVSAVRAIPGGVRWAAASARVGATQTGRIYGGALLDHYTQTLGEIRQVGYGTFVSRQIGPYIRAAAKQFSPTQQTLTQRLIDRIRKKKES